MKKRLFFSNILSLHSQQKRWVLLTMRRIVATLAVVVALLFSAGSAWAEVTVRKQDGSTVAVVSHIMKWVT